MTREVREITKEGRLRMCRKRNIRNNGSCNIDDSKSDDVDIYDVYINPLSVTL